MGKIKSKLYGLIMKTKFRIVAAVVAVLAVSCGKVSEVTEISGTVNIDGVTEVRVLVESVVDTLVPVTEGRFQVEVPADVTTFGRISAGSNGTMFLGYCARGRLAG